MHAVLCPMCSYVSWKVVPDQHLLGSLIKPKNKQNPGPKDTTKLPLSHRVPPSKSRKLQRKMGSRSACKKT